MFRIVLCALPAALLLASLSALIGRGALAQFELTVIPSLWTLGVALAAGAWVLLLRNAREWGLYLSLAGALTVLLSIAPRLTFIVAGVGFALHWAASGLRPAGPAALTAVAVVALCQLPAFWVGLMLNRSDVAQAKAYCEAIVSEIDAHYEQRGVYPRSLRDLSSDLGEIPRLLEPESFYSLTGNRFQFTFRDPSGLDQGLCYDSFVGSWRNWSRAGTLAFAN